MAVKKRGDAPKPEVVRHTDDDAKQKALELAVSSIEKQFGKGAILRMDGDAIDREIEYFSARFSANGQYTAMAEYNGSG